MSKPGGSRPPYRPAVSAVLVVRHPVKNCYGFIIAERIDHPGTWQFPQGGIDPGEKPYEACLREVWEELGFPLINLRILRDDLPAFRYDALPGTWLVREGFNGQEVKFLLVEVAVDAEFHCEGKTDKEILETAGLDLSGQGGEKAEFRDVKIVYNWCDVEKGYPRFKQSLIRSVEYHVRDTVRRLNEALSP